MQPEALAWAISQAQGTRWRVLADAYTSGELRVRFADGREVTYRSAADMVAQVEFLRRERGALVAGDVTPIARPRFFLVTAVR